MINDLYNFSDKALIRKWGEKLKTLRLEANFSQSELAEKTGMSRSSISSIEKGRNFSINSLISILRVLEHLDKIEFFLKETPIELTPMEIYKKEQDKKKRAGYKK